MTYGIKGERRQRQRRRHVGQKCLVKCRLIIGKSLKTQEKYNIDRSV
jgi:hypothetical protein